VEKEKDKDKNKILQPLKNKPFIDSTFPFFLIEKAGKGTKLRNEVSKI
jgi:hypothetical protein